jgi:hypothetical protein
MYGAGFRPPAWSSMVIASIAAAAPKPRMGSIARRPRRSIRRALTGAASVPAEKAPLAAPAAANDPVAWWTEQQQGQARHPEGQPGDGGRAERASRTGQGKQAAIGQGMRGMRNGRLF